MVNAIDSRTLQKQEVFMKLGDYKPYVQHVQTAATVGTGIGLVKAGFDIARGNTSSYVGSLVLPKGTRKEVSWQRGLIGGALAVTGAALAFGQIPFPSKK